MIVPILSGIIFLIVVFGIYQLFYRYIYGYRLTDNAIQIVLFNIVPMMSIRYADITNICKITFWEALKPGFALRWGNRVIGECVMIQKKTGLFRSIIITPENATDFIEKVKQQFIDVA